MGKIANLTAFFILLDILLDFFSTTTKVEASLHEWSSKYAPDLVTKETVLADNRKLIQESIRENGTVLVVITSWNPRGYHLVRQTIDRLTYISPAWFAVVPFFQKKDQNLVNCHIEGNNHINQDFIRDVRKLKPAIKIVPHYKITDLAPEYVERMVDEIGMQKVAQTLANHCHEHGFDGLFLEIFVQMTIGQDKEVRFNAIEAIAQMGNVLRRNGLIAILSLPSPLIYDNSDEYEQFISKPELDMLIPSFDLCQIHSYNDISYQYTRTDKSPWIRRMVEHFGDVSTLMIGLNFYGVEYKLKEYRSRQGDETVINAKRFLEVLKDEEALYWWNPEAKEHELTLRKNNSIIFYPSMSSLEYRIRLAAELNVGLTIWDYGMGLDYFTNLV